MTDTTPAHEHGAKPIRWLAGKESVFGTNKINAVLECEVCGRRRQPKLLNISDFKQEAGRDGRTIYRLKEGL